MSFRDYLDSFINFEHHLQSATNRDFQLDRMYALLDDLGNPQKQIKTVQIAGSKGKGSTSIFLSEILREAGYRVGLYTSPHLFRVNERIRILSLPRHEQWDDGLISDEEFDRLINQYKVILENYRHTHMYGRLTYYEVITALMFCWFRDQKVDIAVLETGLGGRYDATNTAESMVCGITPISLEHTNILGTTIEEISTEKSRIIKHGVKSVVVGGQKPEALQVLKNRAEKCGAEFIVVGQDLEAAPVTGGVALIGNHQFQNAAMAAEIANCLEHHGFSIEIDHVDRGFMHARWPGRFEVLRKSIEGDETRDERIIVLDCAHNKESMQILKETLEQEFFGKNFVTILGVSSDKDVNAVLKIAESFSKNIIYAKANHPRAYDFNQSSGGQNLSSNSVRDALRNAKMFIDHNSVIVVTGSIFVVAEARLLLVKGEKGVSV